MNTKSELQKALEKQNDKRVLKEMEKERQANLTPFEKAIGERARRIEEVSNKTVKYLT